MTVLAAVLAGGLVVALLALYRQQVNHLNHLTTLFVKGEAERRSLLDRIQHPLVRQVEQVPVEVSDPPRDAAEFAQVGQVVPEFVHVGSEVVNAGS